MSLIVERPIIAQQFTTFAFTVPVVAAPVSSLPINTLITTFMITVPAAALNSVFLGTDGTVTTATGLELIAGTTSPFRIDNQGRQVYELQAPLMEIRDAVKCTQGLPEQIPFVVWDMSTIYLVAAAPTTVTVALFKEMYI